MIENFFSPGSIEEAVRMKSESKESCCYISGGTEINRLNGSCDPKNVVNVQSLLSKDIVRKEGKLIIGAGVSLQQILDCGIVPKAFREFLHSAAVSRTLRNMASLGGNIGAKLEDSYVILPLLAYCAHIITADITEEDSFIEEKVPLREYIENNESYQDSLILEVHITDTDRFVQCKRIARSSQSKPACTIAFGTELSDSSMHDIRMYVAGAGIGIQRLEEVEKSIRDGRIAVEEQLKNSLNYEMTPDSDFTGSAEYKKYIIIQSFLDIFDSIKIKKGSH